MKNSKAKSKGYNHLAQKKEGEMFNKLSAHSTVLKACKSQLYGALHIDFMDCRNTSLPSVTLHSSLCRSPRNTSFYLEHTDWTTITIDRKVIAIVEKQLKLFETHGKGQCKVIIPKGFDKICGHKPLHQKIEQKLNHSSGPETLLKGKCF